MVDDDVPLAGFSLGSKSDQPITHDIYNKCIRKHKLYVTPDKTEESGAGFSA